MKTRINKILSAVLAMIFTLAIPLIPNADFIADCITIEANAAGSWASFWANDRETAGVYAKLQKLEEVFYDGSYFTSTGYTCGNNACSKCLLSNFNAERRGGFPTGAEAAKVCGDGNSCCGFAKYIYYCLFNQRPGHGSLVSVKEAKVGDYVMHYGEPDHFGIFLGYDGKNVYIYDANWPNGEGGRNVIHIGRNSYYPSQINGIYHPTNYSEINSANLPIEFYRQYGVTKATYYINTMTAKNLVLPTWIYEGYANYNEYVGLVTSEKPFYRVTIDMTSSNTDTSINVRRTYSYEQNKKVISLGDDLPIFPYQFKELKSGTYNIKITAQCYESGFLGLTHPTSNEETLFSSKLVVSKEKPSSGENSISAITESIFTSRFSENNYYNPNSSYPIGSYTITAKAGLNYRWTPRVEPDNKISALPYNTTVAIISTVSNWGYAEGYGYLDLDYCSYNGCLTSEYEEEIYREVGHYFVNTIAGLCVRENPSANSNVIRTLANGTEFNVTKTSGNFGYAPSYGGWLNLTYASYYKEPEVKLNVPAVPDVTTKTSSVIAVGDSITVNWDTVEFASEYTASLVDASSGVIVSTKPSLFGTTASFVTPYAGKYNVIVTASNAQHKSTEGGIYGIEAKDPSTVTFKDWDGTVLATESIAYNQDAVPPATPSRIGHTFSTWIGGNYKNVKADSTVTASYTVNKYKVTFYAADGTTVLKTESVPFGSAASAPKYNPPTGTTFVQWSDSYDNITSEKSIKAIVKWTSEYPLELDVNSSVIRDNEAYVSTAIVNNSPNAIKNVKVILALKTAEDKQLAYVESSAFSVAAGATKNIQISAEYDGCATVANLFVVEVSDQLIPLSQSLSISIDQGKSFSSWTEDTPPSTALKSESRKEYSFRTKEIKTSSKNTLDGYTLYKSEYTWGNYSTWSPWQNSSISAITSENVETQREVKTQTIPATYKTQYKYYHYSLYKQNGETTTVPIGKEQYNIIANRNGYSPAVSENYHSIALDYPLDYYKTYVDNNGTEYPAYMGYNCCNTIDDSYDAWYYLGTQSVVATPQKTQYSYRTRDKIWLRYFYRFSDWSEWQTEAVSASDTREVKTRTVYRYLDNVSSNIEDKSGEIRTISSSIPQFAGRQAIITVKDTLGTVQYIGQVKIGNDGSFLKKCKFKDEPSITTGDYTVYMSIEGTNAMFVLNTIKAPLPVYTVNFCDWDGSIFSSQTVTEGNTPDIPEPPVHEGYSFVKFSKSTSNITADITTTAIYALNSYDILFVDDLQGTTTRKTLHYGDILTGPNIPEIPEGYIFKGWDADGTTVTESLVVNAVYEKIKLTVEYKDFNGNTISAETVEYGDAVADANIENTTTCNFIAWEKPSDTNYVTQDIVVTPYFDYSSTCEAPEASVSTGTYNSAQTVSLSCATPGAKIYYTTDGTYPLDAEEVSSNATAKANGLSASDSSAYHGKLYTRPFKLSNSADLVFVAVKDEMNASECSSELLAINTGFAPKKYTVNLHYNGIDCNNTILVDSGTKLSEEICMLDIPGWTINGIYTDKELTTEFNIAKDSITSPVDLYFDLSKNVYTVTFTDCNDDVIDVQAIEYSDSAIPPMPKNTDNNHIFTGWDKDYSCITENVTIKATYLARSELTSVELSEVTSEMQIGSAKSLKASVVLAKDATDDSVIWISSDDSIVTVDETGEIKALRYGSATIYAVSNDSAMIAECSVHVLCDHNFTSVVTPPTCTEKGFTTHTCSICNDSFNDTYTASLGHKYGAWETIEEASCKATGLQRRECFCGEIEEIPVEKAEHKAVIDKGTPATCIEIGISDGSHCSVCGEIIQEQKILPKTEHPDNDEDGYCDYCGENLSDTQSKCTHLCHKTGFMGFIWKIINLFNKLFKINQYCECGAKHW